MKIVRVHHQRTWIRNQKIISVLSILRREVYWLAQYTYSDDAPLLHIEYGMLTMILLYHFIKIINTAKLNAAKVVLPRVYKIADCTYEIAAFWMCYNWTVHQECRSVGDCAKSLMWWNSSPWFKAIGPQAEHGWSRGRNECWTHNCRIEILVKMATSESGKCKAVSHRDGKDCHIHKTQTSMNRQKRIGKRY